jgi:hypothetical protein
VNNEFQTTQKLDMKAVYLQLTRSHANFYFDGHFNFPFDQWNFKTVFMAVDRARRDPIPIWRITPVGFADDFLPQVQTEEIVSRSNGTHSLPSRMVTTILLRPSLSISFNMLIFFVNWMLAFAVLFISLVTFRRNQIMMPELLVLPITVVLTIPSLRNLMVGSPFFGKLIHLSCQTSTHPA